MELHFYPGQNLLILHNKSTYERFEAWGGPSSMGTDPHMAEEPTWPGTYIIHGTQSYITPTWPMSKIKWGTQLMDRPSKKPNESDVWYKLKSGKWGSVKKDIGISRSYLMKLNYDLYGVRSIPKSWLFNDFGPLVIRWFKDINGNKRLDKNERLSGQMFHTTPINEAQQKRGFPVNLSNSHGCIHLKPADRDKLLSMGAFKPETLFIVRKYNERF